MSNNKFQDKVIRTHDLPEKLGLSKAHIYNLSKTDPTFPKIFKLGKRCSGVMESDADRWLAQRLAASEAAA